MQFIADLPTTAALWPRTRAALARAVAAIGAPDAIAALTTLSPALRRAIAGWIALLESIVRKLLLADAAQLHANKTNARDRTPRLEIVPLRTPQTAETRPKAQAADRGAPARRTLDLSQPRTWRARFALMPIRDQRACPERCAPRIRALWGPPPPPPPPAPGRRAPHRTALALRLAFRLEAVRRVIENPLPHAQRLARLLARLRRSFPDAARRLAIAPARPCFYDPGDPRLGIDAIAKSIFGAHAFADSS